MELVRLLIAIVFPPIAVFLRFGLSMELLVNVLLTLLGYIPGLVHAVWILAKGRREAYALLPITRQV